MAHNHPEHDFIFIFDRKYDEKFLFSGNITPVVVGPQARHPLLFVLWFELSIPWILKKYKADVFLSPDGYLSLRTSVPSVAIIHDLNFEENPQDIPVIERKYYKYFFPRFARKAKVIGTVSEYSKSDIMRRYSINKERVKVIYNGVSDVYSPISEEEKFAARQKYTNGKNYFLYVGALHQRKNLVTLFKAFDDFKGRTGSDMKLLIVGKKMWWTKSIEEAYKSMDHIRDVIFEGHMSTKKLRHIYGAATALTFISYFEGFGIPVIEAFACGVPVLTSNRTSLPEIAGDAAIIVEPFDLDQISKSLEMLATNKNLRDELISKGLERCKQFSWESSAEKLYGLVEEAARNR